MSNIKEFELITNEIHKKLKDFRDQGLKLVGSSSFQTQSVPLLHILSQFESKIEIIFLDTGFLHPETHQFRKELTRKCGDRKSTRLNSSHVASSYAVFCLKNKNSSAEASAYGTS